MKRWPIVLALVLAVTAIAKGGWTYYAAVSDAETLRRLAGFCGSDLCQVRFNLATGEINAKRVETDVTRPSMRF